MDRNNAQAAEVQPLDKSLSARRAWIEICFQRRHTVPSMVALRKESVDRNCVKATQMCSANVALRKESVDRNAVRRGAGGELVRRSPQGERG